MQRGATPVAEHAYFAPLTAVLHVSRRALPQRCQQLRAKASHSTSGREAGLQHSSATVAQLRRANVVRTRAALTLDLEKVSSQRQQAVQSAQRALLVPACEPGGARASARSGSGSRTHVPSSYVLPLVTLWVTRAACAQASMQYSCYTCSSVVEASLFVGRDAGLVLTR